MKKVGGLSLCLVLMFSCSGNFDTISRHTVESDVITVGILSDLQLPTNATSNDLYVINTQKAMKYFKSKNIDVLINAGDLTNVSDDSSYAPYTEALESTFGSDRPVTVQVMGNHDYWNELGKAETLTKLRERFTKATGDLPWTHKVVNGYHFLAISPANGNMDGAYGLIKNKIRAALDSAVESDPQKPIFVVTHQNPQGTVYGSEDWGNRDLTEIFSDYPQIISFSGHSHFSLLDERSLWQGSFTAINTQSVSYIELEEGKENGSIPPDAEASPMVLIMEIRTDEIRFIRYNLAKEREEKEDWILALPLQPNKFRYTTDARKKAAIAPVFSADALNAGIETTVLKQGSGKEAAAFRFSAASHNDFVHSYQVKFSAEGKSKTYAYFSDFCAGLDSMTANPTFAFPKNLKAGTYSVEITAVESFGKESSQTITGSVTVK